MKFQNLKDEVTLKKKKLFCDHVIMQHRYCHTRLFYRKKTYMTKTRPRNSFLVCTKNYLKIRYNISKRRVTKNCLNFV